MSSLFYGHNRVAKVFFKLGKSVDKVCQKVQVIKPGCVHW